MRKFVSMALLISAALSTASSATADTSVSSVNVATLKAIFDRHQIQNTVEKSDTGVQVVQAKVGDEWILAAPTDCPNKDQTAACRSVSLTSAAYGINVTGDQMQEFMRTGPQFAAALRLPSGEPMLRYVFDVSDGVGPMYVENRMAEFYAEEQVFRKYLMSLKASTDTGSGGHFANAGTGNSLGLAQKPDTIFEQPIPACAPCELPSPHRR